MVSLGIIYHLPLEIEDNFGMRLIIDYILAGFSYLRPTYHKNQPLGLNVNSALR